MEHAGASGKFPNGGTQVEHAGASRKSPNGGTWVQAESLLMPHPGKCGVKDSVGQFLQNLNTGQNMKKDCEAIG